jgi:uncharacterized protein YrrD
MFRISDLLDLPVKCISGDRKIKHTVKSLLIDGNNNRIAALICKEGSIKKYVKLILYEKIAAIDINGIVIVDQNCISNVPIQETYHYFQLNDILNQLVKNETGSLQGIITDIYINLLNGEIVSYEISEGYLDDFLNGRKIVGIGKSLRYRNHSEGIILHQEIN